MPINWLQTQQIIDQCRIDKYPILGHRPASPLPPVVSQQVHVGYIAWQGISPQRTTIGKHAAPITKTQQIVEQTTKC